MERYGFLSERLVQGDSDRDLFFYNFESLGLRDNVKDLNTAGSSAESRVDLD